MGAVWGSCLKWVFILSVNRVNVGVKGLDWSIDSMACAVLQETRYISTGAVY